MFGVPDNHVAAGSIAKHTISCNCASCQRKGIMAKRDLGQHEEKMHLMQAHAMHHGKMRDMHQSIAYGYDNRHMTPDPAQLSTEVKAKHLEASSAHGMAQDHFTDAACSYRDDLPKGAAEHEKIATSAAEKAKGMSEKLGVKL